MNYLSLGFALFVAVVLVLYYLLPQKIRGGVLLISSLFFYACFNVKYLFFLLFTGITTYSVAKNLFRFKAKKTVIGCCIAANAALWFMIKELPWIFTTLGRVFSMFHISAEVPAISFLVPVGISYFTLQAIAYLVDVYKGNTEPEQYFWKYLLFLSWFPAIVQGPISKYQQLKPQLFNSEKFTFERMRESLLLILFGLIKKLVIADRLAIFVGACFTDYEKINGIFLYLGAVSYSIQLFADFSGCVDICRGVSSLFGVELINNFNRPYLSRSIKEFWDRWHISFSEWLKNYIYIPLGGNRKGTARRYINVLVTFLVSSLWHGAGFGFLAWGLLHGVYQIVWDRTFDFRKKIKGVLGVKEGSLSERLYQTAITFNLVTFAWIFFRANSLSLALSYIVSMFTQFRPWELFDNTLFSFQVSQNAFTLIFLHLIGWVALELKTAKQEEVIRGTLRTHGILRWIICLVLVFDVILFGAYGSQFDMSGFLYGGF